MPRGSPLRRLGRHLAWAPLPALFAAPWILSSQYWTSIFIAILFKVLLTSAVRLNHLMGFVSLGQVGFMLVGAYTSALLAMKLHVPPWVGLGCATAVAFALAFLLGYTFLRVKGIYFVILTFLTAETLRLVAGCAQSLTGGPTGLAQIPSLGASLEDPAIYYLFLLGITLAIGFFLYRLEHSRLGFYWRAIAESESLCAAAGMNTTLVKTINFAISAAIAGLAGALWAHYETVITPSFTSVFGAMSSIFVLVYLYAGGTDHFFGPALGTSALIVLGEVARVREEYVPIIVGAVMIAVVLLMPEGIAGRLARAHLWLKTRMGAT
jgi:branched-chain amino acid transport system permease protein